MFEREDWTLFRNIQTLGQKAGVPLAKLPALVAKELADNALDAGAMCWATMLEAGTFAVEDDGPGIPGTDDEVAAMFSIARPLRSSKLVRLPTRGALGNGLRVVAGAVLASGGAMEVSTRGRTLALTPRDDGTTAHERRGPWSGDGTRVIVRLGPALSRPVDCLGWAREAMGLAGAGSTYTGKASPYWYDSDAFFDLLQAARGLTVRELVADLDGCAEPKAGRIAAEFRNRAPADLGRVEAERLLGAARSVAKAVQPRRLGAIGRTLEGKALPYAKLLGHCPHPAGRGSTPAKVPFVLEAWAEVARKAGVRLSVNRTPVTGEVEAHHVKAHLHVFGCGLAHEFEVGRRPMAIRLNLQTPFMPITSDGKAPDFKPFADIIYEALGKATRKARKRPGAGDRRAVQKDLILANLDGAIAKASDGGRFRYSLRQLFYAVRPFVLEATGKEPEYGYFGQVITAHEADLGRDLPGIYRDSRGTLYHPHSRETIPLGTMMAESYRRPAWSFNKILYCEKEGFFPLLRDARWPERHDCALMTSKGFASRAARDVLDLLGETDEPLTFYCIHDADGPGTLIYQALQEGTAARAGRKVDVVNLGLEPAEAKEMGLQVEPVERKGGRAVAVAGYVDPGSREWLQHHRVELNAMTTSRLLGWLDGKFAAASGKVVPPVAVLARQLAAEARLLLAEDMTERAIREARVDDRVAEAMGELAPALAARAEGLGVEVAGELEDDPSIPWTSPVGDAAREVVEDAA